MDTQLQDYIHQARQAGLSDLEIRQNLLKAGWPADKVDAGFDQTSLSKPSHPLQPPVSDPKLSWASPAVLQSNAANSSEPGVMPRAGSGGHKKLVLGIVIAVLLAGGGGFYVFAYNSPARIWQRFSAKTQTPIYRSSIKAVYTDDNSTGDSQELGLGSFKNIVLSADGTAYIDGSNSVNPVADATVKYSFGSGNTSFNTGVSYRILGKMVYFKIDDNPFLDSMFQQLGQSQKIDWLSIDLNELQKQNSSQTNAIKDFYNLNPDKVFNQALKDNLSQLWKNNDLIKIARFMGRENINGISTLHYQNTLDKQAAKTFLTQSFSKIVQAFKDNGADVPAQDQANINAAINALVDKLEIKSFETWVGAADLNLYRVHVTTNAPALSSMFNALTSGIMPSDSSSSTPVSQADQIQAMINKINFTAQFDLTTDYSDYGKKQNIQAPANPTDLLQIINKQLAVDRDDRRLADLRQLASSLELYYNDKNSYPQSLQDLVPDYISALPASPVPPDGNCSPADNTYTYQKKSPTSYIVNFCLGTTTGAYQAGKHQMSEVGIQ